MASSELHALSIAELGGLLRRGEVSPRELVANAIDRLERIGGRLNAVVALTAEVAEQEATLAEAEMHRGLDRGPLHGIPYGLKDIFATVGTATTWGAAPFRDQMLDHEAMVVTRLRDAGAILVAKLATVEIAGGMGYDNPDASISGPPLNPRDPSTWTSGSSSGPAAAVAAGCVPFAIGSDTSGSILLPAAWTGTAGLRATYGRVSRHGAMTLCPTMDRVGPICRTAFDCGLVLEAIAGFDPRDSSCLAEPYSFPAADLRRRGFRIGVIDGAAEGAADDVAASFERSISLLGEIGDLESVELPDAPYQEVAEVISAAECTAMFDDFIASGRTVELTAKKAATFRFAGSVLPAHDYIRAQRIRRKIALAVDSVLSRFDAVVAPTIGTLASGAYEDFPYMLASAFARPLNYAGVLTGSPSVSIPNGIGTRGLPSGLHLAGARREENGLLAVATALMERLELPLDPPIALDAWMASSPEVINT
jgi:aspartyl-tRNA(Asn)/glutamyl-tRNA(Gln) amidotransferase subunit A